MFYWSNHLDYEVIETWYGLVELNWFHWPKSGELLGGYLPPATLLKALDESAALAQLQ